MIDEEFRRASFSLLLQRTLFQHLVHILPMKHVVDMSPALLVIVERVDADRLARPPVAVDELAEHNRIALLDIDTPLVKPTGAVCGARDRGTHLTGEVVALVDADIVSGAAEGNGCGHAADATTNDANAESFP